MIKATVFPPAVVNSLSKKSEKVRRQRSGCGWFFHRGKDRCIPIGTQAVNEIMLPGHSMELSFFWTYSGGNPTIFVFADNQSAVAETDEQYNHFNSTRDQHRKAGTSWAERLVGAFNANTGRQHL